MAGPLCISLYAMRLRARGGTGIYSSVRRDEHSRSSFHTTRHPGIGPDQRVYLYLVNGGEPPPLTGVNTGEEPISWSADGQALYV
jgi:hypothetical protein